MKHLTLSCSFAGKALLLIIMQGNPISQRVGLLVSDGSFTISANNNCTSINMQINKCNARCSGYLLIALKWSRETEVEASFHRLDSLFYHFTLKVLRDVCEFIIA